MESREILLARLEALLFVHGEPLLMSSIAGLMGVEEGAVSGLLGEFQSKLSESSRGLALIQNGREVQLVSKPEFASIIESFVKESLSEDLSPASVETLAVISYFGPLNRSKLEFLRGVNSGFILRSLLIRGLVDRVPDPVRRNAYLYSPSFELLKHLGVASRESLPGYDDIRSKLSALEQKSSAA